jgi:hypothetical protein
VCRYILIYPSNKPSRPQAKAASGLPRLQLGRIGVVDELGELFREPLDAKGILIDAEDEFEVPRPLR